MNNRIIGLDLSLSCSAYHNGDELSGLVDTDLRGAERLLDRRTKIFKILDDYDPQLVVVEGYAFGARGHAFSIGELGGLIKLGLYERGFRVILVPPKSLKLFVTGNGNAGKDVMMLKTFRKYGVEFESNDLCDAYGLAQVGKAYLNGTDIEYEKRCLAKVEVYC